jgi:carboxypeptidase C (cathepsin A)
MLLRQPAAAFLMRTARRFDRGAGVAVSLSAGASRVVTFAEMLMKRFVCLVAVLVFVSSAFAEPPATAPAKPATRPAPSADGDRISVTEHAIDIAGEPLRYRASAGTMLLKTENGKPQASYFFVAYEKLPEVEPRQRPITFVFNGGPGAAAVWLHLGTCGPMRIDLRDDGLPKGPPFGLVPNESTWLTHTDLVFIDPVNTGYSRPAEGVDPRQFFGVEEDVRSVGQFIRLYLTRSERWGSPIYVAGESYGTTRGAALSEHLLDRYGIALNGLIMVSSVLDFRTVFGDAASLPVVLYLPTYTATAAYHGRIDDSLRLDLPRTLDEVRRWAIETYLPALARGASLEPEKRAEIAKQLSWYTGLSQTVISQADLRISSGLFQKHVLGDPRRIVGRFDGRIVGDDPNPLSPWPSYDPSLSLYLPVYSATINQYVRRELKFESDLPYEVLSDRVQPWTFRDGKSDVDVTGDLADAMRKNPSMRVLFASAYHDLATPFFATDYTISQLRIPESLRKNITQTYYEGGHMMYHLPDSRRKLWEDVTKFIGGE